MRTCAWLFLSFGLVLGLHGCGEDENTGGTGNTTGTGNTGGGGGGTAMVSGTVLAAVGDDDVGVEGATVSVVGSPGTSTTSGPGGTFELEVPVGSLFLHATTETDFWGVAAYEVVPAGGATEVELELISEDEVGQVELALGKTADPAKGIVALIFVDSDTATAVGGETATLSEADDFSFVFDDEDTPVEGTELIAGGGTDLIFVGVGLTDSLTVTATDAADAPCPTDAATYPVLAKTITDVELNCP